MVETDKESDNKFCGILTIFLLIAFLYLMIVIVEFELVLDDDSSKVKLKRRDRYIEVLIKGPYK